MLIIPEAPFQNGYNTIIDADSSGKAIRMDFGVLRLDENHIFENDESKERAFLLLQGKVIFEWEDKKMMVERGDFFVSPPSCLHVSSQVPIRIVALSNPCELTVHKTINERNFPSALHGEEDCRVEERGKGTLEETSTRIVRTIFDIDNSPESNLVLGEVLNLAGRWSSYPPHYHNQPEIYFYKIRPDHGFAYGGLGENVYKLKNNSTMVIDRGLSHPQVAAPGYALFYVWVIRHLENDPYKKPTFEEEHLNLLP
jgi:5-deoxy-glucuronate isomerase